MPESSGWEGPPAWTTAVATRFLEDLDSWTQADHRTVRRVILLMRDIARDPFTGAGTPEALKHLGPGMRSRRIN